MFFKLEKHLINQLIWNLKKMKIWKSYKLNSFTLKIEIFSGKSQKWPPAILLHSDGNLISIITWCSYSAKIKLQYINNIFHVTHFRINMVLSTKNMFKEVNVIKSRGALGTGFTYAPVLCFKPAVNRQPGFRRWDSLSYIFQAIAFFISSIQQQKLW